MKISKTCDASSHRQLIYVGDLDGVEVEHCPECKGLRLRRRHWTAPHVSSIRNTAEAFRAIVPKAGPNNLVNEVALQNDLIKWCRDRYGMGTDAVRSSISWLIRAGKEFQLSVNGVPHRIEAGLAKRYSGLVRLCDVLGDPPITYPIYTCISCKRRLNIEDLLVDELFRCPCGSSYNFRGQTVEPLLRVNLKETWDLNGNILNLTIGNMQSQAARYSVKVLKNRDGSAFVDEFWSLAPGQQGCLRVRNPTGSDQTWRGGDKLHLEVYNRDTNEILGWSDELICSDHPWTPLAVGFGAIAFGVALLLTSKRTKATFSSQAVE